MNKNNKNPSSVQVSQTSHFKLKKISAYCDIPQSALIDLLVNPVYEAVKKYATKVMETGDVVTFESNVTAYIQPDTVFQTFNVPMDNSQEKEAESERQRNDMIQEQFIALEEKKKRRKKEFQDQRVDEAGKPLTQKNKEYATIGLKVEVS